MNRLFTSRFVIVILVFGLGGLALGFDIAASKPLNPFTAPPLLALGSGQAAGGAHCAAVPGS
jgi:hypothetical protein